MPASQQDAEIPAADGQPAIPIRVLRPATTPGGREVDTGPLPTVVYLHGGGWVRRRSRHPPGSRPPASAPKCTPSSCRSATASRPRTGSRPPSTTPCGPPSGSPSAWPSSAAPTRSWSPATAPAGNSPRRWPSPGATPASRWPRSCCSTPSPTSPAATPTTAINQGYMSRWSAYKRFGLTLEGMATSRTPTSTRRTPPTGGCRRSARADLTGVAPAVIHTSTLDVLRTEGNFYGDDLRAAGVDVIAREHPSLNHSYFGLGGVCGGGRRRRGPGGRGSAHDPRDALTRRPTSGRGGLRASIGTSSAAGRELRERRTRPGCRRRGWPRAGPWPCPRRPRGRPRRRRPTGTRAARRRASSSSNPAASPKPVLTGPGHSAVAVTPVPRSSPARLWV